MKTFNLVHLLSFIVAVVLTIYGWVYVLATSDNLMATDTLMFTVSLLVSIVGYSSAVIIMMTM